MQQIELHGAINNYLSDKTLNLQIILNKMQSILQKIFLVSWTRLLGVMAAVLTSSSLALADPLEGVHFEYAKRCLSGIQHLDPPSNEFEDMGHITCHSSWNNENYTGSQSNGLIPPPLSLYPARLAAFYPFPEKNPPISIGSVRYLPDGFSDDPSTQWLKFYLNGYRRGWYMNITQIRAWAKVKVPAVKTLKIPMIQVDIKLGDTVSGSWEYGHTSIAEFVIPKGETESKYCDLVDRSTLTYADLLSAPYGPDGPTSNWINVWMPLSITTSRDENQPLLVGEHAYFHLYHYSNCPTLTPKWAGGDVSKIYPKLKFTWRAFDQDGATIAGPSGLGQSEWPEDTARAITSKPGMYTIVCTVTLENGQAIDVTTTRKVVLAAIAVDANRDGEITFDDKDKTMAEKPFRFWINNDDDDYGDGNDTGGTFDRIPAVNFDHQNNAIDFIRDLEDFTRISLDLPYIYWDRIKTGEIQVGLRWSDTTGENPAINIFWQADQSGGQIPYFASIGEALNQAGASATAAQKVPMISGNGASYFPKSFLDRLPINSGPIHLLFEGVSKGKGRLDLVFRVNGQDVVCNGPWISLMDVAQFYTRGRASLTATQISDPWTTPTPPTITSIPDNIPEFVAEPNETEQCIIHVHGWRMTELESKSWSETTFKRLWQLGYKGRFATFRWATFSDDTHPPIGGYDFPSKLTYNRSEYRSWLCGRALAQFVNGLPYQGHRYLVAHSMGNVIAGKALQEGMKVDRYAMCNAAMAAMSYDGNITNFPLSLRFITPDTDSDPAT